MSEEKYVIVGPPNDLMPKETSFSNFVLNSLKSGGDAVAQVNGETGQSTTYNEILQKSVNLAVSLRRMGLGKGDVVCICSENRFEFTITAYAVFYIGGVVSTMNITYTPAEIKHSIKLSKPRYVICSPLMVDKIKPFADSLDHIEGFILYGNKMLVQTVMFNSLIEKNEDVNSFKATEVDAINDHLVILNSSGTTGLPKGVMLTHSNFLHCAGHLQLNLNSTGRIKGEATIFSVLPWFHAFGFMISLVFIALRYKFVFALKFEEEQFLRIIQDQKACITIAAPPLILFLNKHPSVENYDLSSLKEIWCGAAPLSKELQDAVEKRLNLELIKQGYGMTEMTLGVLYAFSKCDKSGSAGTICPGAKAKVVDMDTGENLGPFKEGELCFKAGIMMKGYIGDLTSTSAIFDENGWLHTGDVGYYDNDNYFYVIDRLKELIKYKAYQVPPAEIEAILLQHKAIKDAAVIGLPDVACGEKPLAFVVLQPNQTVTSKDIEEFVASRISPAKRLRGGVRFVNEIPKNPSGKILRRLLREQLKREMSSKL